MRHPVNGARVSQGFSPEHRGVDFASPVQGEYAAFLGTPVLAAVGGYVQVMPTMDDGYGNWLRVQRSSSWEPFSGDHERYAHLDDVLVAGGQAVAEGDVLGTVGYSGKTEPPGEPGTHLHFEVWRGGVQIDPLVWLRDGGALQDETGDPLVDMMLRWPTADVQAQKILYWMEVAQRLREAAALYLAQAEAMARRFTDPNGPLAWQLHLLGQPTPEGFKENLND